MKIAIYTNHIPGGWSPISTKLKGSEECIVELAKELSSLDDITVSVFSDFSDSAGFESKTSPFGLRYFARDLIYDGDYDILIIWKDREIDLSKIATGTKVIKWSSDVEDHQNLEYIDHWVNLTQFHEDSNAWVPKEKSSIIPHGIDYNFLNKHKVEKIPNTVLYCSSPDRGLFRLLTDWDKIKKNNPELVLNITYGLDELRQFGGEQYYNQFKSHLDKLLDQKDINFLGNLEKDEMAKEYWKAEYWILPLENPNSELFCLNAVKSHICNCTAIVDLKGALTNVVQEYIDYSLIINKKIHESDLNPNDFIMKRLSKEPRITSLEWDHVIDKYWLPLFKKLLAERNIEIGVK